MAELDPHVEIERLEAEIEALAERLAGTRKFILAGQVALAAGGVLLAATLLGAITYDPRVMLASIAALLGGIVFWGSNVGTAREAAAAIAKAEAERSALIGALALRPLSEPRVLH
jgi:hypothetical protein